MGRMTLTLKKKYASTNVLKYSFFHRMTDLWNQLPLDIRCSDNVNIKIKSRVKKFLGDLKYEVFFLHVFFEFIIFCLY